MMINFENVHYGSTFLLSHMCGMIDTYAGEQHHYIVVKKPLNVMLMIEFWNVSYISTLLLRLYVWRDRLLS